MFLHTLPEPDPVRLLRNPPSRSAPAAVAPRYTSLLDRGAGPGIVKARPTEERTAVPTENAAGGVPAQAGATGQLILAACQGASRDAVPRLRRHVTTLPAPFPCPRRRAHPR